MNHAQDNGHVKIAVNKHDVFVAQKICDFSAACKTFGFVHSKIFDFRKLMKVL